MQLQKISDAIYDFFGKYVFVVQKGATKRSVNAASGFFLLLKMALRKE